MFILILLSGLMAAPAPASRPAARIVKEPPRVAADKTPFPPVEAKPLGVDLPVIEKRLGCLPEEIGGRVYARDTIAEAWKRHGRPVPDTEWLGRPIAGAEAMGFDLWGGRVSRIVLVFDPADKDGSRLKEELSQAAGARPPTDNWDTLQITGPIPLNLKQERREDGLVMLSIEPSLAEWYLRDHPETEEDVAWAIRHGHLRKNMTLEQAVASMGRPSKEFAVAAGTEYHWTQTGQKRLPPSQRLIRPGYRPADSIIEVEVPKAIAVIKDGRVVELRSD